MLQKLLITPSCVFLFSSSFFFTAKQCPYNMVFEESGSPCMDTCTHQDASSLCEEHKIDGCFCPPGEFSSHTKCTLF